MDYLATQVTTQPANGCQPWQKCMGVARFWFYFLFLAWIPGILGQLLSRNGICLTLSAIRALTRARLTSVVQTNNTWRNNNQFEGTENLLYSFSGWSSHWGDLPAHPSRKTISGCPICAFNWSWVCTWGASSCITPAKNGLTGNSPNFPTSKQCQHWQNCLQSCQIFILFFILAWIPRILGQLQSR